MAEIIQDEVTDGAQALPTLLLCILLTTLVRLFVCLRVMCPVGLLFQRRLFVSWPAFVAACVWHSICRPVKSVKSH